MKMFSDCSGQCIICACSGGCLAGHGDDDFYPMGKEEIEKMTKTGYHKNWKRNLSEDEKKQVLNYMQ